MENKYRLINKGFTLIELSMVIVIIGLIVAGVVGGQAIVRQAKLRQLISEINKWQIAINTFRLEYNALPGDFNRAANYGIGTNGNGNEQVYSYSVEGLNGWQHLSNAKLISGQFIGSGGGLQPGISIPQTPMGDSTVYHFTLSGVAKSAPAGGNGMNSASVPLYNIYSGNLIHIASTVGWNGATHPAGYLGFLTTSDARSVDSKIDDGIPDSGLLYVGKSGNNPAGECVNT